MNLGLYRREHLHSGNADLLGAATVEQFQRTHGAITAWQEVEHTVEGRHTAVHAESLDVAGDALIHGNVGIDGNVTVTGALTVAGEVDLDGRLTVSDLVVEDDMAVLDQLSVGGGTTLQSNLIVNGATTLRGTTVQGNLSVTQQATAQDLTVTGSATVGNTVRAAAYLEGTRGQALGWWTDIPLASLSFTTPGGPWTPGAGSTVRYALIGKTVCLAYDLTACTIPAGATGVLSVTIPASLWTFAAPAVTMPVTRAADLGVVVAAYAGGYGSVWAFLRVDGGTWSASPGQTYLPGVLIAPIM